MTVTGGTYNGDGQADDGYAVMTGDALAIFGGIVDLVGTVSYVNDEANDLVFEFTGLDPEKRYTVVHFAGRNGTNADTTPYGWPRAALATISDADGFLNNSTVGIDNNGDPVFDDAFDPSTRYSADNSEGDAAADGWVVRFDEIAPGVDGDFTLTMSWDGEAGSEYKGKYSNALMLEETTPPPPPEDWVAYNDMNVPDGAPANPPTVTDYTYAGHGRTAGLRVRCCSAGDGDRFDGWRVRSARQRQFSRSGHRRIRDVRRDRGPERDR